jgi:ABC-type transport system involved in multi-copper enzyme maturation permease subunit
MSYEKQPQPDMVSGPGPAPSFARPASRGTSIASVVVGLASIFVGWSVVVPLIGLVLGLLGLQQRPVGKGTAITGLILNGLMLVGWTLLVLIVVRPWEFSVPPQH